MSNFLKFIKKVEKIPELPESFYFQIDQTLGEVIKNSIFCEEKLFEDVQKQVMFLFEKTPKIRARDTFNIVNHIMVIPKFLLIPDKSYLFEGVKKLDGYIEIFIEYLNTWPSQRNVEINTVYGDGTYLQNYDELVKLNQEIKSKNKKKVNELRKSRLTRRNQLKTSTADHIN